MALEIFSAAPEDALALATLMQEAADFKLSRGDILWGPEPFTTEEALSMIATGNVYVARIDGYLAGSTVLTWEDERMWDAKGLDQDAAYIHRLASGDKFRGQRVGEIIVSWVSDRAREARRPYLRLDCEYDSALSAYYERLGFQEVERVDRPASKGARNPNNPVYKAALYQKSI